MRIGDIPRGKYFLIYDNDEEPGSLHLKIGDVPNRACFDFKFQRDMTHDCVRQDECAVIMDPKDIEMHIKLYV